MEFVDVEEAKNRSGLRLALVANAPSPWGEAAKGIFQIKKIPFVGTRYLPGQDNTTLVQWTGTDSAPAAMYEKEKPRTGWAEILLLAERLAPQPRLIPEEIEQRAWFFGLVYELCGEMGFGWCRRLMMVDHALDPNTEYPLPAQAGEYLGAKYGYRPGIGAEAQKRVVDILRMFAACLQGQRAANRKAKGSRFLLGDSLTALDVYWATFAALVAPLPPDQCPMMEALRAGFEWIEPEVKSALDPALLEHRDFIYNEYLELPMQL